MLLFGAGVLLVVIDAFGSLFGREHLAFDLALLLIGGALVMLGVHYLAVGEARSRFQVRVQRENRPIHFWFWTLFALCGGSGLIAMSLLFLAAG